MIRHFFLILVGFITISCTQSKDLTSDKVLINSFHGRQISASAFTYFYIDTHDNLYGLGDNSLWEMGNLDQRYHSDWVFIKGNIKSVKNTEEFTFILDNEGNLWGVGNNHLGQLGVGDYNVRKDWTLSATNVKKIIVGKNHAFYIDYEGDLFGTGTNTMGELGLGDKKTFSKWGFIASDVEDVATEWKHSLLLKKNGDVYQTGSNEKNQLGLSVPELSAFTKIEIGPAIQVGVGYQHSLILTANGDLYGCGSNVYGELGFPKEIETVKSFTRLKSDITQVLSSSSVTFFKDENANFFYSGTLFEIQPQTYEWKPFDNDFKAIFLFPFNMWGIDNDNNIWVKGKLGDGRLYAQYYDFILIEDIFKK